MTRFLAIAVFVLCSIPAFAMPQYLEMYRRDPFRNPSVDGCNTCHMSAQGGDARNAFGEAFDRAGYLFTPMLRAQFPDRFVYPVSRGAVTVHFSDPDKKQAVVEVAGSRTLIDADRTAVNGSPVTAAGVAATAATASSPQSSEVRVDQDAREGAFFGANVVNLPNGKPLRKGGSEFFIGHRFTQNISDAGLSGLFGFDSSATVGFGARFGITERLSASVMRSNLSKTISLGSAFQVSRQSSSMPVTLQVRGGVDGQENFGLYEKDEDNNFRDRQYSPYIQTVATRTFGDRVSLNFVPMIAFNTRNEAVVIPELAEGADHNHTLTLGIGAGYRFLPSVSIVAEYLPRVWGFKSERRNTPGLSKDLERFSFGLQKSTFRHTFELVVSRQSALTPALYSFQGADTFRIGFNIYRKLR